MSFYKNVNGIQIEAWFVNYENVDIAMLISFPTNL